jgi:DegV family protein with EDD domain
LDNSSSIVVITDSSAHFPAGESALLGGIQIVPYQIIMGGRAYREGIDLDAVEGLRMMATHHYLPTVQPPTTAEYQAVFDRAARQYEAIVVLTASREINHSWANARAAAQPLLGHCKIDVIDSGTLSTAQALLVLMAARWVGSGVPFDELVRRLRGAVERTYSVYYVETTEYLAHNGIMSDSHSILGSMLAIKPFITLENGRLHVTEKVRTRIQAVERLVEYATEFTDLETGVIVQHRAGHVETTRMLHDRLTVEFPDRVFPTMVYGVSLAALIGMDATGLVILERDTLGKD